MQERDSIEALAAVFGPLHPVDNPGDRVQRNVRIHAYTDGVVANLARTSRLPYGTMLNLVLDAGLQALENRLGTRSFEKVADVIEVQDYEDDEPIKAVLNHDDQEAAA